MTTDGEEVGASQALFETLRDAIADHRTNRRFEPVVVIWPDWAHEYAKLTGSELPR